MKNTQKQPWEMTREEFKHSARVLDGEGGEILIGSRVKFMSLYGIREVLVTSIGNNNDGRGFYVGFDMIQIGPEEAFKPVDKWHVDYLGEHVSLVDNYDLASKEWLESICKGGPHYVAVRKAVADGELVPDNVLADYPDKKTQTE